MKNDKNRRIFNNEEKDKKIEEIFEKAKKLLDEENA
jgi:hypothetical protein